MSHEWIAWAKEEIISLSKIVREKNAEIERLNRDIEMTRAVWEADKLIQQECGARSMLDYVTRHYAVNKVATDDEVFKFWKDAKK